MGLFTGSSQRPSEVVIFNANFREVPGNRPSSLSMTPHCPVTHRLDSGPERDGWNCQCPRERWRGLYGWWKHHGHHRHCPHAPARGTIITFTLQVRKLREPKNWG